MPKLIAHPTNRKLGAPDAQAPALLYEIALEGFIDAANYLAFEKSLAAAHASDARYLILDFSRVHYINSTGISALIRYHELFRSREGALCLASVAKEVGLSMHLLGVTSFIPFLKDLAAARSYVEDLAAGRQPEGALLPQPSGAAAGEAGGAAAEAPPGAGVAGKLRIPLQRRKIPGIDRARVLVITPSKGRFTRVLRLRFRSLNGDYHLLHDVKEALQRYDEMAPDLVVIDNRSDPKGEFVSRVKIHKERSLTSIIKLYARDTDVEGGVDFKIWENDYLIEPFEVLELFSLTEAELTRLPKDKKVLHQQVHFEFRTTQENVEKAYKLADVILRQAGVTADEATALYAAVKEGIDNAAIHGNRFDGEKSINVNFLVDLKKVTVLIEDEGTGFDYEYYLTRLDDQETFERAKRRILDEGVRGGLGILLMSKCTNRLEYSGAGNILRLEKNL